MKGHINHLEFRIEHLKENMPLYKKLFEYFNFAKVFEFEQAILYTSANGVGVIVGASMNDHKNDRDAVGLNHFTIGVDSREEVDMFIKEFMEPNNLKPLFGTPKERPEIMKVYYQVMFEMPGGLLLEVVHNSN